MHRGLLHVVQFEDAEAELMQDAAIHGE